jgi:hypothetical protein
MNITLTYTVQKTISIEDIPDYVLTQCEIENKIDTYLVELICDPAWCCVGKKLIAVVMPVDIKDKTQVNLMEYFKFNQYA